MVLCVAGLSIRMSKNGNNKNKAAESCSPISQTSWVEKKVIRELCTERSRRGPVLPRLNLYDWWNKIIISVWSPIGTGAQRSMVGWHTAPESGALTQHIGFTFLSALLPLRRQIGLLTLSYSALLSIITPWSMCKVTVVLWWRGDRGT